MEDSNIKELKERIKRFDDYLYEISKSDNKNSYDYGVAHVAVDIILKMFNDYEVDE